MKATSVPTATRPEITCPWGAPYTDQTWVEVDCAALRHNLAQYKGILGEEVKLMPIVKANAYGHGLLAVSRELIGAGVDILGVVNINEALRLREEGISKPVLVLGYTDPRRVAEIPAQNPIALAVYDLETARAIAEVANNSGRIIPLHLKVDSGLHRLGMVAEEAVDFAKGVADLPGVSLAGLFTHFAAAETPEHEYTAYQFGRFSKAIRAVRAAGFTLEYVHATASAGALCLPETRLNLVRLGIALYGLWPSAATKLLAEHAAKVPYLALLPALSWQARVIQVKDLSAGVAVGYGCDFHTKRPTRLAVIPVGYADGYDRGLSGRAEVLLHGKRAPVIGKICMNMLMVDVTDLPAVHRGDLVTLIGRQEQEEISADELAAKIGSINYEIVTRINWNLPRVYQNASVY